MASKSKSKVDLELVLDETPEITEDTADAIIGGLELFVDEEEKDDASDDDVMTEIKKVERVKPGSTIGLVEEISDIESMIVDVDEGLDNPTICIYGKNGTGKTTMLSTYDGVLILAPDEGTLSIREKAKGSAKKVFVDTWGKVEAVYWLVHNGKVVYKDKKPAGVEIKTKGGKFIVRAIAWDTVTSIARVCMRNVVLGAAESSIHRDIVKKTLRDWGDMSEKLRYWLSQYKLLRDKGILNIWTLQETTNSEDVESEEFSVFPDINRSIRGYILEEADLVMRTMIGRDKEGRVGFKISGKPNPNYITKDRTGMLSGIISNPDLSKMLAHAFKK